MLGVLEPALGGDVLGEATALARGNVQVAVGLLQSFEVCPGWPQLVQLRTVVGLVGIGVALDDEPDCEVGGSGGGSPLPIFTCWGRRELVFSALPPWLPRRFMIAACASATTAGMIAFAIWLISAMSEFITVPVGGV